MKTPLIDPIFVPSELEQAVWIGIMWAAVALLCVGVAFMVYSMPIDAVSLSISGQARGQGVQNLSFAGDLLNVSLNQSSLGWNLSVVGQA
jgi:hypothetical protein